MKMTTNRFDESTHTYSINDRVVPSVTQILTDIFGKRFWYDEWYAQRGRANHAAISYYVQGCLDFNSVSEEIKGYLEAFIKFLDETKFNPIKSEEILFSTVYNFAGTPDLLLTDPNGQLILADIKSSVEPIVKLQLAGYDILYSSIKIYPKRHCAIELSTDGKYKIHWFNDIQRMRNVFLSCLSIYNFKTQNKLTQENKNE
ncbi:MAG: hypothetical protein PHV11_09295 [Candidatus Bipolaricaulis sp.]|nr:hypothetical protein [Candidatus Bipolaricaulis sp.]